MSVTQKLIVSLLSLSLTLIACSGDDNQDASPAAVADTVDVNNVQSYSQAVANNLFLIDISATNTTTDYTNELSNRFAQIGDAFATANISPGYYGNTDITQQLVQVYDRYFSMCTSNHSAASHVSGQMSLNFNSSFSYSFSGSTSYNNLCLIGANNVFVTLNGKVSFSGNQDTIKVNFNNFSVAVSEQTSIVNCSISLNATGITSNTCSDIANAKFAFKNSNDNSLLNNISVSSDQNGTYLNIDGTIKTGDGFLTVTSDIPLKICSSGIGGFEDGLIIMSGSNGSQASLDFNYADCSTAQWCVSDGAGGQICDVVTYRP